MDLILKMVRSPGGHVLGGIRRFLEACPARHPSMLSRRRRRVASFRPRHQPPDPSGSARSRHSFSGKNSSSSDPSRSWRPLSDVRVSGRIEGGLHNVVRGLLEGTGHVFGYAAGVAAKIGVGNAFRRGIGHRHRSVLGRFKSGLGCVARGALDAFACVAQDSGLRPGSGKRSRDDRTNRDAQTANQRGVIADHLAGLFWRRRCRIVYGRRGHAPWSPSPIPKRHPCRSLTCR